MVAWTNGDTVAIVESNHTLIEVMQAIDRIARLRYQLRLTRSWLVIVSLALLATWLGLAYVWAVNRLT